MKTLTKKKLDELAKTMNVIPEDERNDYGSKKSYFKSFLAMLLIINALMLENSYTKGISEDTLSSSVGKWHPKMFYIVMSNLRMKFILPYEPDQSGFYNLFFISKESERTLLFDTIVEDYWHRNLTPFSSENCYDVVLLYNNGKYVKQNDIIFENGTEVDMSNQRIQPSDSISEYWKMMRSFNNAIKDRASDRDNMTVSNFNIRGYVYSNLYDYVLNKAYTWQLEGSTEQYDLAIQFSGTNVKSKRCTYDGYFEIDVEDDTEQTLSVSALRRTKKINITAPCGLLLVMEGFGRARRL